MNARTLAPTVCSAASVAFLVALTLTFAPMADRWTALPFALFAWGGFLAAAVGTFAGQGRTRTAPAVMALVWIVWWIFTWNDDALDAMAAVRRATLAFIAF